MQCAYGYIYRGRGRRNKFNNKVTYIGKERFDSEAEANYFLQLKMLKKCGDVADFKRQVPFMLQPAYIRKSDGKKIEPIKYIADFVVTYKDGHEEVIDVKGKPTEVYLLKRKILEYRYPDIDFREVKA